MLPFIIFFLTVTKAEQKISRSFSDLRLFVIILFQWVFVISIKNDMLNLRQCIVYEIKKFTVFNLLK